MAEKLNTLFDAMVEELRDLYSAESQLLQALPKMEAKATNQTLKQCIGSHLEETREQLQRLEKIAAIVKQDLGGKTCKAMKGLIEEGKEVLEQQSENSALVDALLIGAARRVEHYEIAAYCTTHSMAIELGQEEIADLLSETFDQETAADDKLSTILQEEILPEVDGDSDEEDAQGTLQAKPVKGAVEPFEGNAKRTATIAKIAIAAALISSGIVAAGSLSHAESRETAMMENESEASKHPADNTGRNARDVNEFRKTADTQSLRGGDETKVLASIRREIVANDSLSTNGKNVKIMVEDKTVTLRGPVNSAEEKSWIETATMKAAPDFKVMNQLEVSPS